MLNKGDLKGAYVRDFVNGSDVLDLTEFNIRKRDVTVEFNADFDDVVLVVDDVVLIVLEDILVSDVTLDMILVQLGGRSIVSQFKENMAQRHVTHS